MTAELLRQAADKTIWGLHGLGVMEATIERFDIASPWLIFATNTA